MSLRLCIFCRSLEAADKPCPWLQSPPKTPSTSFRVSTPWTVQDEALLESLRQQPSALCQRCSDYDIVNILKNGNPLDLWQLSDLSKATTREGLDDGRFRARGHEQYIMEFGKLSSFHLTPSCQLCRMIYRILPRPPPAHDHELLHLSPSRWYSRRDRWEMIPDQDKSKFASLIGFRYPELMQHTTAPSLFGSDRQTRLAIMTRESIALDSKDMVGAQNKSIYNAQYIGSMINFDIIKEAHDRCAHTHAVQCQPIFHPDLLTTRMIDVTIRKVVPCPPQCGYLALSYVWGGVVPSPDALENNSLPQTIEDAIIITQKLGKRYLWVDALCIDQTPNPTPAQAAAKLQQLNIMHLIYSGATLTIYSVSGKDSRSGMPGVSRPRIPQTREIINGHTLFTIPSEMKEEIDSSVWHTRGWTFQEKAMGKRQLFISDTHFQFQCGNTIGPSMVSEAFDTATETQFTWSAGKLSLENPKGGDYEVGKVRSLTTLQDHPELRELWAPSTFEAILEDYTARDLSKPEEDSLNACQGIMNYLAEGVYPSGFCWGLPLRDYPYYIGWTHDAREQPTRRTDFPSWTWAGYGGKVRFPPGLVDVSERDGQKPQYDFVPRVQSLQGKELTLQGWVVTLEIRTEPFSEVIIPGSSETIGCVREGNSKHNNTLPSGTYRCLVAARVKQGIAPKTGLMNQQIFMIVLKGTGKVVERQTIITLSRIAIEGRDFEEWKPEKQDITLI